MKHGVHHCGQSAKHFVPILVVLLPVFLSGLEQSLVASAVPAIVGGAGDSEIGASIIVSYLIGATISAPIYGNLGDALGLHRLLTVIGIYAIASLLCAQAQSIEYLIFFRFIQGLSGGGLISLSQALLGATIPPRDRAGLQGYMVTVAFMANTFGPAIGSLLILTFGWPAIFLMNIPLCVLATLVVLLFRNGFVSHVRTDCPLRLDRNDSVFRDRQHLVLQSNYRPLRRNIHGNGDRPPFVSARD